jgi:hypothetical protein
MLKLILAILIILLIILIFLNFAKLNHDYQTRFINNSKEMKKLKKVKKKKLKKIKNKIRPFDLICFRCGDLLSSIVANIEYYILGNGDFTHVGMVVTTDIIPIKNGIPGRLYVLESTLSGFLNDGVNNTETNGSSLGMQIRDLEDIFNFYINHKIYKMAWCQLINNPLDSDPTNAIKEFRKFYYEHKNAQHDFNLFPFIRGLISDIYHTHIEHLAYMNKRKFFCSELIVAIYIKLGILPETINPAAVAPIDIVGHINNHIKHTFHSPIYLI